MTRFTIVFACMFLLVNVKFLVAQDNQVKVRVFDGTTPEEESATQQNKYNSRNFININPYLLARGAFTIGYERALHEKHSISVDVGLTYRDYVYEFATSDDFLFSEENVTVEIGHYLHVAYKLYPKGINDFDGGFYVSPLVIFRDYKLSEDVTYFTGTVDEVVRLDRSYKMREYALKFGYCVESWWFDDLIADVYFGVGSRQTTYKEYDEAQNYVLVAEPTERKPALYLGVKLGLVF
jgi:hypothetical protein